MELFLKFEAKTKLSSISWKDACYVEYCYAAPPRKLLPRACCSSWAYCFFSACYLPRGCLPRPADPSAHDAASPRGMLLPLRMMLPPLGMLLPLRMMLPPPGHAASPAHDATSPGACCSPCA